MTLSEAAKAAVAYKFPELTTRIHPNIPICLKGSTTGFGVFSPSNSSMRGIREGDLERSWRALQAIDALADGMTMWDVIPAGTLFQKRLS